jgi:hypothetical protein
MEVLDVEEYGLSKALLGMALSYWDGKEPLHLWWTPERQQKALHRANLLAFKQGGHNKFLESIGVWITMRGTRGFWQEFDTYRVGVTKQSASTMHTLSKRQLTPEDFHQSTDEEVIRILNGLIVSGADVQTLKANLPEGFYQMRVVFTNYKTLQNMVYQRSKHRLKEWPAFIGQIVDKLEYPQFVIQSTES